MKSESAGDASRLSRRDMIRAGGLATVANLAVGATIPDASTATMNSNIYTRIGVRPFINATAALTINGGLLTLPSVKRAMDEASYFSVNINELMEKVGERLAELLGCEDAIVTSGDAAALTHATVACVAGADPEKMQQLPNLAGLKDEVIMPAQSRNQYDHAIRMVGVKVVNVDTQEDFQAALGRKTAMVALLGETESRGRLRLEELAAGAHKMGIPVLVDAAPEFPTKPNRYLTRGADLVAYSGGKVLAGPQCAGILIGRKDLIRAAWLNSAPHHAFGRAMKVGKEEAMGMLAAVEELMTKRDVDAEKRMWQQWFTIISDSITKVPGVKTTFHPGNINPHPALTVEWDSQKIGLTAGEISDLLLTGEPRIMSQAAGEGYSFPIRAGAMKPGDAEVIALRLSEIFTKAPKGKPAALATPATNVAGRWDVEVDFVLGSSSQTFFLDTDGNRLDGSHFGGSLRGELSGTVNGDRIRMHSSLPIEGTSLNYTFTGSISQGQMVGEVALGEYGHGKWKAHRHVAVPRRSGASDNG